MSLVQDLDGYPWQLLELHRTPPRERLCTLALGVSDLGGSLQWYQVVLGMTVLQKYEASRPGKRTSRVLGGGGGGGGVLMARWLHRVRDVRTACKLSVESASGGQWRSLCLHPAQLCPSCATAGAGCILLLHRFTVPC